MSYTRTNEGATLLKSLLASIQSLPLMVLMEFHSSVAHVLHIHISLCLCVHVAVNGA